MKKIINKITLFAVLIAVCMSFAGCNILTIRTQNPSGNNPSSVSGKELNITESYGETYKVKSVSLNQKAKAAEKSHITATSDVYESVVTIHAGVTGGTQIGSGVMVDIDVKYENSALNDRAFVYIITCHHVIEGSSAINVYIPKLKDAATGEYEYYEYAFGATLMGSDKDADIAVLRIEINNVYSGFTVNNIKKAEIASYELVRGEDIFAVGCPTGELPGTVSYGKVSNVYVKVSVDEIGDMILHQTDTATNSGNSGGGIFNFAGQLVGILNAGASDYDGLSFFIPITGKNGVEAVASSLTRTVTNENYGYIEGKWKLGASFTETQFSSGMFGSSMTYVYVTGVDKDSAFAAAGVSAKDFILSLKYEVNGETKTCNMENLSSFKKFYAEMQEDITVGDSFTVEFTSNPRNNATVRTATLTQYIYNSKLAS